MNKQEFLTQLRKGLVGLPEADIEERLLFYSEMIEDRKEDGLSEEEAVSAVGSVKGIVAQVVADTTFSKIAKKRIRPKKRLSTVEIVLLILGSPIWLSLGIAAFAVALSLYASLWAVIISLWAVFTSFIACSFSGVMAFVIFVIGGNVISGISILTVGMVCAGLSIFTFYGCKAVTKGILILTKKIIIWIKNCFIRKAEA